MYFCDTSTREILKFKHSPPFKFSHKTLHWTMCNSAQGDPDVTTEDNQGGLWEAHNSAPSPDGWGVLHRQASSQNQGSFSAGASLFESPGLPGGDVLMVILYKSHSPYLSKGFVRRCLPTSSSNNTRICRRPHQANGCLVC